MNKYLEKIAARISTVKKLQTANDYVGLVKERKKKKKVRPSASASRKWNRGTVKKN